VAAVPLWDEDEALLEDLAEAVRRRAAVPPHRRDAARAAFAWRTIDAELLQLTYDSAELAAAAVRGSEDPRLLAFSGGDVGLELEVGDDCIWGQVTPSETTAVVLETSAGARRSADTDESGIFTVDRPAAGPLRFVVERAGHEQRTEWVVL
jgi:hypothetical protein